MVSFKGTIILKNGFIATSTSLYAEYYIKLCNPLNGNLENVVEMKTSSDSYCIAEFSNNRLVSLLRDGLLQIWNLSDSSLIKSFEINFYSDKCEIAILKSELIALKLERIVKIWDPNSENFEILDEITNN